jgi:hypothetical protein
MAPIRSATVSEPVDEYTVVLVPSPTLIVPFGGIPRVERGVLAVSGIVPVPVAGVVFAVAALFAAALVAEASRLFSWLVI